MSNAYPGINLDAVVESIMGTIRDEADDLVLADADDLIYRLIEALKVEYQLRTAG